MPRNMSFALTKPQYVDGSKTVTRRLGWWFLKTDDLFNGVEKAMGLKKGEKIKHLGQSIVCQTYGERLDAITQEEVNKEGFPHMSPEEFVEFFCASHKNCTPATIVNVIRYARIYTGKVPH